MHYCLSIIVIIVLTNNTYGFLRNKYVNAITNFIQSVKLSNTILNDRPKVKIGERRKSPINKPQSSQNKLKEVISVPKSMKSSENNIILYQTHEEINNKIWDFSHLNTFNSTTIRTFVEIQNNVSSSIAKIEETLSSWLIIVLTKIERDLRTTSSATEFIQRRALKDTVKLISGVDSVIVK